MLLKLALNLSAMLRAIPVLQLFISRCRASITVPKPLPYPTVAPSSNDMELVFDT